MTRNDELTGLFTTYFGDKLSPAQIEDLAADVIAAQAARRARLGALSSACPSTICAPTVERRP